ncbi:hypothetical protein BDV37DRAFT_261517 [Aspergillus pseudonomiae]|uniref:Uncharacterized protein n=1 Tax=Aspergillus pseudonomiae TaxID=1506151 RepID=A0A5N7CY48_9EURO|nr:uncharacterized protein BDV37DRAFT_261517 [Aspergillus pseudonomiae]KAE8399120.1 hypothetical protein BDV37DRAFT_261517 [Aspergillus pseudonomiae]
MYMFGFTGLHSFPFHSAFASNLGLPAAQNTSATLFFPHILLLYLFILSLLFVFLYILVRSFVVCLFPFQSG